jgi:hypothetical protein
VAPAGPGNEIEHDPEPWRERVERPIGVGDPVRVPTDHFPHGDVAVAGLVVPLGQVLGVLADRVMQLVTVFADFAP